MESQPPKLLSVGALYLDIICHDFPFGEALWPEHEVVGSGYDFLPGGSAVNFACTAASLGLATTLIGKTGTDGPGESLHSLLEGRGVTLKTVSSPVVKTNMSINFNGDAGELRTTVGTANQSMTATEVIPSANSLLDEMQYLYLGGCLKLTGLLPALPELAREAKRKGVCVVVDHGRVFGSLSDTNRRYVRELCTEADIYLPSVDELLKLWNANTLQEAVERVREGCSATLIVKNAARGVTAFVDDGEISASAYAVKVDNPVGAGDGFNAGFIRAHSQQQPIEACLDFGCATAALKISQRAWPTVEAVEALRARPVKPR